MHHWTVYEKVDFPKCPLGPGGGVYSTTCDPDLRNEVKKFSYVGQGGYIQQVVILNSEMKYLH